MSHHLETPLAQLKGELLADGVIDAAEVAMLRERLYEDGVIDREEADFLFEINNAVSGKKNDSGWQDLFVEAIADHVLADEASPGVVDEAEAAWLHERLWSDGKLDAVEKALLKHLKAKAHPPVPAKLRALFDLI